MNLERLQIWIDALNAAEVKRRPFDLDDWLQPNSSAPCGFTACAVGDLSLYRPAMRLGWRPVPDWPFTAYEGDAFRCGPSMGIRHFLAVVRGCDAEWVENTIMPACAWETYGVQASDVTRQMVLKRLRERLAAG